MIKSIRKFKLKSKLENKFYHLRDLWFTINFQIENNPNFVSSEDLKKIIEESLYNQRDMLIEIDRLNNIIATERKETMRKKLHEAKKREVIRNHKKNKRNFIVDLTLSLNL